MARRRNVGMLSANFGQSPVDGTNIPEMPDHVAHRQSASQIPASSTNSAGSPEIPSCSTNSARSSTGRIYMYLRGDIGSHAEFQSNLRAESNSGTKSTGKKRMVHDETDEHFIEAINLFSEKSDSRFNEMSLQMADLAQHVGSAYESSKKRASVYDILGQFDFLSLEERVHVSQYLCKNSDELELFFSLPDNAKAVLVRKILNTH
ncbi:hypothetical protein ACS0TY_018522 [Phlomoides rotata]